ncbi:MAG: hypothetical protein LBB23_01505 [Rickettsiales bacterium]|nr:hypothetical protein [Rickettsiales bacterium]
MSNQTRQGFVVFYWGLGKRVDGSNHPVRLRFATARHPATIGGEFIRRDPGVKPRDDLLNHYPVCLRHPPLRQRRGLLCDYQAPTTPSAYASLRRDTPSPAKGNFVRLH